MSFENHVAIVTGGGTGIGRATSLLLAERGATVVLVYAHSRREAEETVQEVEAEGGRAIAIEADVSDETAVKAMVKTVVDRFGRIDLLVNNAGITRQLKFDDLEVITDEIWDAIFAVNVKGSFYCSRAVAPHMRESGAGAIVNVGSIAGITGLGSSLPYAVSKSAVHGLTRSLARALAPEIRVNCVAPGAVATRWWAGNEEKMHALAGDLPLGRIVTPDEVARLVIATLEAPTMTAQVIVVDSGQTL